MSPHERVRPAAVTTESRIFMFSSCIEGRADGGKAEWKRGERERFGVSAENGGMGEGLFVGQACWPLHPSEARALPPWTGREACPTILEFVVSGSGPGARLR